MQGEEEEEITPTTPPPPPPHPESVLQLILEMEGVPLVSRGKERKSPLGLTVGHKERITRPLLFSPRLQRNVDAPEEQLLIKWNHILVLNRGLRKGRESELKEHKSSGQGRVQGDLLMGQSTERPTCPHRPRVADLLKEATPDSPSTPLPSPLLVLPRVPFSHRAASPGDTRRDCGPTN